MREPGSENHPDCDGCDNPDRLRVKRVERPDGSELYLCADCRADLQS